MTSGIPSLSTSPTEESPLPVEVLFGELYARRREKVGNSVGTASQDGSSLMKNSSHGVLCHTSPVIAVDEAI